ncbi:hypothetical protein HPB48_013239 [Haemaphysalis longicornis]|uniref:THAP-type domain-containing protein n=1 Tax=Haemaphysalis longicornis TaxID=44386 RepID=A0A9J6FA18_HAELO|nr:hypothetical protein HPB48_013239 [Haemaphysalis longicornis]
MASVMKPQRKSTCFVPLCSCGYHSNRDNVSLFKAPTDPSRLSEWEKLIKRVDRELAPNAVAFAKQFDDTCIDRSFKIPVSGVVNEISHNKVRLKLDDVPTVFEGYVIHLIPKVVSKRKVRDLCKQEPVAKRRRLTTETVDEETTENVAAPEENDRSFDLPEPLGENRAAPQLAKLSEGHAFGSLSTPATWIKLATAPTDTLPYVICQTQANDFSHLTIERMVQFAKPVPERGSVLATVYLRRWEQSKHVVTSRQGAEPLIKNLCDDPILWVWY